MLKRRKTEAMVTKRCRAKKRMSLSNEREENYECDTGDKTDSN